MDISAYEVSLRFLLGFGRSWWDVTLSTSNTCFVSGPRFSTSSFQPPDLAQLLQPSRKANVPPDTNQVPSLLSLCHPEKDKLLQPHSTRTAFQLLDIFNFSILRRVWPPFLQHGGVTYLVQKGRVLLPCSWGIFISKEGVGPFFLAIESAY